MRILRLSGLLGCLILAACAFAEVQVINGRKYECRDGLCYLVEESGDAASRPLQNEGEPSVNVSGQEIASPLPRIAQGYMRAEEFVAFLEGKEADSLAGHGLWVMLLLVLLGGLAMNLTPCVLPMMPINLMIIGRSATRGALYGLGIAIAYGILGVLAAVGGMAFGQIQSSPWFNLVIALIFAALGLSMLGVFFIDFSRGRGGFAQKKATMLPGLFAFTMGMVSAVLAGACVAPILIAVLVFTAKMYAAGNVLALALPFVLGLGMGLPWPFAGAGLQVLPKPGGWMKWVNKAFGVLVLGFAAWYGLLAWRGFVGASAGEPVAAEARAGELTATPETFPALLADLKRPVFVDCWATWCKNCAAMERTTLKDADVVAELGRFTVVRLQAEDIAALRKVPGFAGVKGLPAFAIFE